MDVANRNWKCNEKVEAIFDSSSELDCKYRYLLKCDWDISLPKVTFVMLNPSVADTDICDPTLSRCINYAKKWGYGGINAVNLFAYISTDPKQLKKKTDPVGKLNDKYIIEAVEDSKLVVFAWGTEYGKLNNRNRKVVALLKTYKPHCLKKTKDGDPSHPLYLSKDLTPISY
ncbi:DUF1643 domain-containing protein [Planococcus maitriensis]|uniref:DUF1643 domain-containing protein n=1 Tax=Planococcus maitriensis TaxID=221799 RepID=A0A365K3M4_9BACL|nr:DUF1643 domain-containing protein [Planococcus maitriensis]